MEIPVLLSEKVFLASQVYIKNDPFVGVMEIQLNFSVDVSKLNQAYKKTIQSYTSFHLLFKKSDKGFNVKKELQKLLPPDLKLFTNKKSFSLWKSKTLAKERLNEMGFYKGFLKRELVFKFHHLILDARSLSVFFQDLFQNYFEESKAYKQTKTPNDFQIYKKVMTDFVYEEQKNKDKKKDFWLSQLKLFKDTAPIPADLIKKKPFDFGNTSNKGVFSASLNRFQLKKISVIQSQLNIKWTYLLFALYSKALQQAFDMDSLILRVPFSARHILKEPEEKNLIASLSRSAPLFLKVKNLSLQELAFDLKKQCDQTREHLIMDQFPLLAEDLKTYSHKKKNCFSLSMSYFFYKEQLNLARFKNFYWQSFFLDLTSFVILSDKNLLLYTFYNPLKFSKKDIKGLLASFKQNIKQEKKILK